MVLSMYRRLLMPSLPSSFSTEDSIREELFSTERLEQHARSLASAQTVSAHPVGRSPLAVRLRENQAILLQSRQTLSEAVREGHSTTAAADWLLDNFHLVEEQIREVHDDLPMGFYRELPKLANGPFAGYPRVFGLAWAYVAHTDSRFEAESFCRFVTAYQSVQPLTIGELWAVAITLRIVLVENLRRAASRIVSNRATRQNADAASDRLLGIDSQVDGNAVARAVESVGVVLPQFEHLPLPEVFAVQLVQRLRDQDPKVTPALIWLEQRLAAQGTNADELVQREHQRQGATAVTMRNIITSMRSISSVDWSELFERISLVDEVLRGASGFAEMDFPTRNLYRSAIEQLARGCRFTELDIARAALQAAAQSVPLPGQEVGLERERDAGHHLIAAGRRAFEKSLQYRVAPWRRLLSPALKPNISGYILGVLMLAALGLWIGLLGVDPLTTGGMTLFALLGAIPAIDLAVALLNRLVTTRNGAAILPGMALLGGIPASLRTLVVVPMLLTNRAAIDEQVEGLEIHFLASQDGDLQFALLSDWTDATVESMPADAALLQAAVAGIERLNARHGPAPGGPRFALLHRRRVWNASQGTWLGWERKRGKLHELNRLLRGATDTTFVGSNAVPGGGLAPAIRYVITLDGDTRLPRTTVRRLVGKMAHPLNRPRFDAVIGRVVEGYALLQPRVTPSLPIGRGGSRFQRIFSSMSGIDPYASAVSDVYQDLFGEGSYAGKGIYDVDAFEAALAGRVGDNTLLSHDLFEGSFARAGLASDIEVVDEFPAAYHQTVLRQHRWARGDWQLLPWILGRGDQTTGPRGTGALTLISRWKMLDNLRRTLSAPAVVLALLVGWTLPWLDALAWTGFLIATIALPTLLPVVAAVFSRSDRVTGRSHLQALRADCWLAICQTALAVTFLAHQAWSMGHAIVTTLFRLFVSHRQLLEWTPAAQPKLGEQPKLPDYYRMMNGAVVIALCGVVLVGAVGATGWPIAVPFLLLWLVSPLIARWASLAPQADAALTITDADRLTLRLIARRTWRYFETFVTVQDHYLPPDNFQEDPRPVVARRTSPTNIGLYLLSAVAARDFGWSGTFDTVERLEATFATLARMERHRGHFYNWYGTADLRPLDPPYISSVDSGNLAGHLIALANACDSWTGRALDQRAIGAGIDDAARLAREASVMLIADQHTDFITQLEFDSTLDGLSATPPGEPERCPGGAELPWKVLAKRAETVVDIAKTLAASPGDESGVDTLYWAQALSRSIQSHHRDASLSPTDLVLLEERIEALAATARRLADQMEFGFLLDPERKLLSIGYRVPEARLDDNCYDLLASEARLASFFAIAKGDLPSSHWFRLGRAVTPIEDGAALVSWSGSMFEYLMPSLVMRAPTGSLLEHTSRLIVRRQIVYATKLGVPWGISESAYNARDLELTYQYSNFGVPGLGLKRGLGDNLVVAPYATALAAMVEPKASVRNFDRLAAAGAAGRYGYCEALDYTRSRVLEGSVNAPVRAFMAHHQGMSIVALTNTLFEARMRSHFHREPMVQATELLLQERTPREVALERRREEFPLDTRHRALEVPAIRRLRAPHEPAPQVHLLSNGHYSVMLTSAGSGYSRWRDMAVTRWREDSVRDDWGSYLYLRDLRTGNVWSATYQPVGTEPDSYDVRFREDRAEFMRVDGSLTTVLEVLVSPEDDAEARRVSVTNHGREARDIELTSYAELVLAQQAADVAHPAFSKLFVQTEYDARTATILATRRRRTPDEPSIWAAHLSVLEGRALGPPQIETDRARFLGRGRDTRAPIAVSGARQLFDTIGTVLDPVFALRRSVRVEPGETVRLAYWTLVAGSRSDLLDVIDKHHDANAFDRAASLAWTQAQVQLRHLGVDAAEAGLFQRLAGHLIFASPGLRPSSESIHRGSGGPGALWAQSISGDLPILLVRIDDIADMSVVSQLLRAQEYWRMKQVAIDLVILNERSSSYVQDLQIAIETAIRTSQSRPHDLPTATRGAVFALRTDLISPQSRAILTSVARVVLPARRGGLAEQLDRLPSTTVTGLMPAVRREADPALHSSGGKAETSVVGSVEVPPAAAMAASIATLTRNAAELEFFNGLGGFTDDGREYKTVLSAGQLTPAPWTNVIANPSFGFQVTVEGGGYTWATNSRENQLTPWCNDPVSDRPGEVLYVRDEDSGELWGPTASPIRDEKVPYEAFHGQGYSRFEHTSRGIKLELLQFVPPSDPIKISRLRIHNTSGRPRHLSITAYVEWVLGPSRVASSAFVETSIDAVTGALIARNPWNAATGTAVAFADLAGRQTTWTGDRREFLGRHGALSDPAALAANAPALSNRVGAGLDPCAALRAPLLVAAGETAEISFFLGQAADLQATQMLVARYRQADLDQVFAQVRAKWDDILGAVQVKTPDRSMDILLNRWLLYQTLVCRVWARSAFYQASGAYGFRDQLQDGMALAMTQPAMTREHLLRAAGRQFVEGDVQHWWLPPQGQGVRTRISDDRLWLGFAVAHYVQTSGDQAVLDEWVPFIEGRLLQTGEHDSFFQPEPADQSASLYEHCARGIDQSLQFGVHGLPLIGTGDWNDGMNRVGEGGKGESVWLGWLQHATLSTFAQIADRYAQSERAASWRAHASALRVNLEQHGWDGDWYRRGFFDDGTAFGSAADQECRIDSIAQSWAVLSGAADPARAQRAMQSVDEQLVRPLEGLALLFTPPFDQTPRDPGYIKGYPPGVRENGGQYTHAAAWSVMAYAALGQGDKAAELFALINPINHSATRAGAHRYKVEPYVVAADVYSEAPHTGRGGWTWYTGSAGWLYRAGIEAILGLRREGAFLRIDPCIPASWPGFSMTYRHGSTCYEITVDNQSGAGKTVTFALLNDQAVITSPLRIPLDNDRPVHRVRVRLG